MWITADNSTSTVQPSPPHVLQQTTGFSQTVWRNDTKFHIMNTKTCFDGKHLSGLETDSNKPCLLLLCAIINTGFFPATTLFVYVHRWSAGPHQVETEPGCHDLWCGSPEHLCRCTLSYRRAMDRVSSCFLKRTKMTLKTDTNRSIHGTQHHVNHIKNLVTCLYLLS